MGEAPNHGDIFEDLRHIRSDADVGELVSNCAFIRR
jgi:hypothetical protein